MRTITITIGDGGGPFDVIEDGRSTGELNFDEMLGTVAQIGLMGKGRYPMKTKEEWEAYNKRWRSGTPATGGANPE